MCFVWISEQTAIISPYNINWLVCITETECGSEIYEDQVENWVGLGWLG